MINVHAGIQPNRLALNSDYINDLLKVSLGLKPPLTAYNVTLTEHSSCFMVHACIVRGNGATVEPIKVIYINLFMHTWLSDRDVSLSLMIKIVWR